MPATEVLRRLRELESRYDRTLPPGALELARCGNLARYRACRGAARSIFFDRFARNAQRAIQARRVASPDPVEDLALDGLAIDLRAARRQGLTWLSRRKSGQRNG